MLFKGGYSGADMKTKFGEKVTEDGVMWRRRNWTWRYFIQINPLDYM